MTAPYPPLQPSVGAGSLNISQTVEFAAELAASMTGAFVKIGTLIGSPRIIIFDNQGSSSVQIGVGPPATTPEPTIVTWRTFTAGEALVLDLATNKAAAPNLTIDDGTTFWGNGASGTFSISYVTAVP
jgi:hypothetical protein